MAEVAIIGTGYVGLTTGAFLAHTGHRVVCADIFPEKIERLNKGIIPIVEPGLDELVREGLDGGRLRYVVGAAEAARDAEFIFLCVQTPQANDGSADLTYIEAAAREIAPVLQSQSVVINKSTVPVGSTIVVERALGRSDVSVVSNPEFLREGSAVHDCFHPDRIVIGAEDHAAAIRMAELYETIKAPVLITDPSSAETIKYASNAFLATKISFVNAIANVCEAVGADVREVVLGMGYDKRIGFEFLHPGPGWGGSCFHPDETVLVQRGDGLPRLMTFAQLFDEVEGVGATGWRILSWQPGDPRPELLPVEMISRRPWQGDLLRFTTKMGRRLMVTPDHPLLTCDGVDDGRIEKKLAAEITTADWLPLAQGYPLTDDLLATGSPLDALEAAGLQPDQVILRVPQARRVELEAVAAALPSSRRHDVRRCSTLRLSEASAAGLDTEGCTASTVTNGTYVPTTILMDRAFWRVVGLWLAEGSSTVDGQRHRLQWSFNHTGEEHLVEEVADYWRSLGVKVDVRDGTTTRNVVISSRILAAWFTKFLGMGRDCYDKAIPDVVWSQSEWVKRWLLSGLWEGDGSWSLVSGGPSAVFEYGTVSARLADGILRLLGDVGVVARYKVGRSKKSTVDAHFITISGADQLDYAWFLFAGEEFDQIEAAISQQSKRIAPTGYRRLSKAAAWLRVAKIDRVPYDGFVYSCEVVPSHTVVTSGGLVAHQCFPKDTRALIHIAEDAGYDFGLLKGVIDVNDEQHERIVQKIERAAGGSVSDMTIAVWGLTFKARTDDRRDSPSINIIERLSTRGAKVQAYDPTVTVDLPGMKVHADPYSACEGASVLAVLTEWDEFRWLDFAKVRETMKVPTIVDARNLLDPATARRRGFTYTGVGR